MASSSSGEARLSEDERPSVEKLRGLMNLGGLSESPSPLSSKEPKERLNQGIGFIAPENLESAKSLLSTIENIPDSLCSVDELEEMARTANKLNALVDYRLGKIDEQYQQAIKSWQTDVKRMLYAARDKLFEMNPSAKESYSPASQFQKVRPDVLIPQSVLDFPVVLFSETQVNDCGRFAAEVYEQQRKKVVSEFLSSLAEARISAAALKDFIASEAGRRTRRVIIEYTGLSFRHHAKPVIGMVGEESVTLEAHTGQPFLLAPQLEVYNNDEGLKDDPSCKEFIQTVYVTSLEKDLSSLMSDDFSDEERYKKLKASVTESDVDEVMTLLKVCKVPAEHHVDAKRMISILGDDFDADDWTIKDDKFVRQFSEEKFLQSLEKQILKRPETED